MHFGFLGTIGTVFLSLCGLPEAIKTIREGKSSISILMIWFWLLGEMFMLAYILFNYNNDFALLINYVTNMITVSIISFYKFWPRKVIFIPSNLDEALIELDKMLDNRTKKLILNSKNIEDTAIKLHSSLGRVLRNRWKLWNKSELYNFFKTEFNIMHPDDITHEIIISYFHWKVEYK